MKKPSSAKTSAKTSAPKRASWRLKLAQKVVHALLGTEHQLSPTTHLPQAGLVVFWYTEGNSRHFMMYRQRPEAGTPDKLIDKSRFPGFFGLPQGYSTPLSALKAALKVQLGDVFIRAIDGELIAEDTIAAAPCYPFTNSMNGQETVLQAHVWLMQITPEQAQLAATEDNTLEIVSVPEYALLTGAIAPSHKAVYGSVLSHLHHTELSSNDTLLDKFGAELNPGSRTVH